MFLYYYIDLLYFALLIIALFCLVLESLLGIPNKDSLKTNLE